jgi:cell wall-associated NlpC family hydrolase
VTTTFPRAAAAAAALVSAAAVCTGAAVAMAPDPGGVRTVAAAPTPQVPAAPAATPAAREPASAARSSHRTPLREQAERRPGRHGHHGDRPARAHADAGSHRQASHHRAHHTRSHAHKRTFAQQASRVMSVARAQRGKPYVWGAAGPRAFDCSGYVQWVYRHALGRHLPKYTDTQWAVLKHIKRHELRRGDLVFVGGGRHKSHVGIYAGHWQWWVAPHTGSHVKKQPIWPARHTFARVVHPKH